MSPNIVYVIATYGASYARRNETAGQHDNSLNLQYQCNALERVGHDITETLIMRPSIDPGHIPYQNYYSCLPINSRVVDCQNRGGSYGQWLRSLFEIDADYYIFTEDDYIPAIENFGSVLVDLYQDLDEDHLYLCTGIRYDQNMPRLHLCHGQKIPVCNFSLGILSRAARDVITSSYTLEQLYEILESLGKYCLDIYQITFSFILHLCHINIKDTQSHLAIFYSGSNNPLLLYNSIDQRSLKPKKMPPNAYNKGLISLRWYIANPNLWRTYKPCIFIPVQLMYYSDELEYLVW